MYEQRRALGLSLEDLSQRTGLPVDILDDLENGYFPERRAKPIALLTAALGHIIDHPLNQAADPDDAARLGALLGHLDQPTAPETLAHALHWPLDRTYAALNDLDQALHSAGHALRVETGPRYAITTAPTSIDSQTRQRARADQTTKLDPTTAQILDTALNARRGDRSWTELTQPDQRAALQLLFDLDLITDDGTTIRATNEIRYDLGHDGAPPGHMHGLD